MKERPILFIADMVNAILEGRKTQTRMVVKSPIKDRDIVFLPDHEPELREDGTSWYGKNPDKNDPYNWGLVNVMEYDPLQLPDMCCPYGQVGHQLWVRETHWVDEEDDSNVIYRANRGEIGCHKWKPSIFMPRWASRIQPEITSVRVERLQDISEGDSSMEGILKCTKDGTLYKYGLNSWDWRDWVYTARDAFSCLWKSINGTESWNANPFVWVVEFKEI